MRLWSLRNAEDLRICTNSLVAADHVSVAYAILQAVARHNATGATRVTRTKHFGAVQSL